MGLIHTAVVNITVGTEVVVSVDSVTTAEIFFAFITVNFEV